jgi:hypothetical protein
VKDYNSMRGKDKNEKDKKDFVIYTTYKFTKDL